MNRYSTWLLTKHLRNPSVRFNNEGAGGAASGTPGSDAGNQSGQGSGSGSSGSSGQGAGSGNGGPSGQSGQGDGASGGEGSGGAAGDPTPPAPPAGTISISEADLQKRIDAAAAAARREEQKAQSRKEAEAQGKFETLYKDEQEAHKVSRTELEAANLRITALATALNKHVDERIKEWPDAVKKLDPGKDNIESRLEWVGKSEQLAQELSERKQAPDGEMGQGSRGQGGSDVVAAYLASQPYAVPGRPTG